MKTEPQGTVRWFAQKSWGAPICKAQTRINIPFGKSCAYCAKKFDDKSEGVRLPLANALREPDLVFYHRECFMTMFGIGETGEHE